MLWLRGEVRWWFQAGLEPAFKVARVDLVFQISDLSSVLAVRVGGVSGRLFCGLTAAVAACLSGGDVLWWV